MKKYKGIKMVQKGIKLQDRTYKQPTMVYTLAQPTKQQSHTS